MNNELKDFIKWCDEYCHEHQLELRYALKHKDCRECWNKVKQEVTNE